MNLHLVRGVVAALVLGFGSASAREAAGPPRSGETDRRPKSTGGQPFQVRPAEAPKLTVRVTPLVRLTRGDARGLVTVPRHHDNRVLRVILESEDYYSRSDIQLDGEEAAQNHHLYWRNLPHGSYWVTVEVPGSTGLRDSEHVGMRERATFSADREPAGDRQL